MARIAACSNSPGSSEGSGRFLGMWIGDLLRVVERAAELERLALRQAEPGLGEGEPRRRADESVAEVRMQVGTRSKRSRRRVGPMSSGAQARVIRRRWPPPSCSIQ